MNLGRPTRRESPVSAGLRDAAGDGKEGGFNNICSPGRRGMGPGERLSSHTSRILAPPLPPAAPLLAVRSLDPRFGPPVQMAPRLRHAHVHSCTASCIHHKHSEARTHTDTLAHNLTQTFPHGSHTTYGCTLAHSLVHIDTRTDAFIYAHKHTIADAHANSASVFPNLSTAFIRLHLLCQSACGGPHRQNK